MYRRRNRETALSEWRNSQVVSRLRLKYKSHCRLYCISLITSYLWPLAPIFDTFILIGSSINSYKISKNWNLLLDTLPFKTNSTNTKLSIKNDELNILYTSTCIFVIYRCLFVENLLIHIKQTSTTVWVWHAQLV